MEMEHKLKLAHRKSQRGIVTKAMAPTIAAKKYGSSCSPVTVLVSTTMKKKIA